MTALGLSFSANDDMLPVHRLDLAAMKIHHFVTADSRMGRLVYRMLFTDGDEREIPMPQPSLFSIHRGSWSHAKEMMDEQLRLLGFHGQHDPEEQESNEAPYEDYTVHYLCASSSYLGEEPSASYFGDATSWRRWD